MTALSLGRLMRHPAGMQAVAVAVTPTSVRHLADAMRHLHDAALVRRVLVRLDVMIRHLCVLANQ